MAYPSRYSKKKTKTSFLFVFPLLGVIGIILILYASYLKYQKTILSFSGEPPVKTQNQSVTAKKVFPEPVRINIKAYKLELPVKVSKIENGVWEISKDTASFLDTSARPGEGGNIVIYGHNKKNVFGTIVGKIKKDDLIELTTKDEIIYTYKVYEVSLSSPENIGTVSPTDYEVLTLYTCTGFLDTKRLIVKALPV